MGERPLSTGLGQPRKEAHPLWGGDEPHSAEGRYPTLGLQAALLPDVWEVRVKTGHITVCFYY